MNGTLCGDYLIQVRVHPSKAGGWIPELNIHWKTRHGGAYCPVYFGTIASTEEEAREMALSQGRAIVDLYG